MKKKTAFIATAILIIVLVLVIPIPIGPMRDGGTRVYAALTYKVVKWHRLYENGDENGEFYSETKVYFFPNNYLSIEELFERELNK